MISIDPAFPDIVLVKKLEKIINDLDLIYINLLRVIKYPEYKT